MLVYWSNNIGSIIKTRGRCSTALCVYMCAYMCRRHMDASICTHLDLLQHSTANAPIYYSKDWDAAVHTGEEVCTYAHRHNRMQLLLTEVDLNREILQTSIDPQSLHRQLRLPRQAKQQGALWDSWGAHTQTGAMACTYTTCTDHRKCAHMVWVSTAKSAWV